MSASEDRRSASRPTFTWGKQISSSSLLRLNPFWHRVQGLTVQDGAETPAGDGKNNESPRLAIRPAHHGAAGFDGAPMDPADRMGIAARSADQSRAADSVR